MTRATVVRAVVAVVVLLVSAFIVLTNSPRLGLDLQGGTRLVVEAKDTKSVKANSETTDRTLEVLRNRIDSLGVAEPSMTRSGENRIIVELPDVQDPREAAEVLGRTAQLTFHPVQAPPSQEEAEKEKNDKKDDDPSEQSEAQVLKDESGQPVRVGPAAVSGARVKDASAQLDQQGASGWFVSVDFHGGGKEWAKLTGEAACHPAGDDRRRVAIVLDEEVISSPQVDPGVSCGGGISGGSTQITGQFGQEEAKELALLIKGGALPVPVEMVEQRTVGPTLGAEAIDASAKAAVIGVALTSLFIVFIYRFFGGLAALALGAYGLISYAALLALGVTLTLPGLAGFVLAIGMAVDANVLVFERAREEYVEAGSKSKKRLSNALTSGFRNALSAIADSNITTLIAAALLFFLASGPVKGFGVTLALGVLASMVSALIIARAMAEVFADRLFLVRRPKLNGIGYPGRVRTWLVKNGPQLFRKPRQWLALTLIVMVVASAGVLFRGLNFGVEFTGGRLIEYNVSSSMDVDTARDAVSKAGVEDAEVNLGGDNRLSVRSGEMTNAEEEKVRAALNDQGGEATKENDEQIGPSLGDELKRNALIALGLALVAQLAYLAIRFRWTFAAGSIFALAHDALVVLGIFAWLGRPIDGVFLAAMLTIIGYSVNDSVVIFDRVRELWGENRHSPLSKVANSAVMQTVPRTVNTGMGAVFILAALAILGGDTLGDFSLALLIGVVVGSYSSVISAVPLAMELEDRRKDAPLPRPVVRSKVSSQDRQRAARRRSSNPSGAQV